MIDPCPKLLARYDSDQLLDLQTFSANVMSSSFMNPSLSVIADMSSVRYNFDAKILESDILGSMKEAWFQRFTDAIEASGFSKREISLKAGMRPGYLHDVIKKSQDPGVTKFLSICKVANISPTYVLYGVKRTPELDELEILFSRMTEDQRPADRDSFL